MEEVLAALLEGGTVSGEELSRGMNITRAAVWKKIEQLRSLGFEIESQGKKGYQLIACPDTLMAPVVKHGLATAWAGQEIEYLASVDSTNRQARRRALDGACHGYTVLSDEQTAGRGRRGRGWLTPRGEGIAMSIVMRPALHPSRVALLSLETAVGVAIGIAEATGLETRIKWPNDIVCHGRKICGMLLEMNADEENVRDVVAGIGINVHQQAFPEEIRESASSLDILTGKTVSRCRVVQSVLRGIETADQYRTEGVLMDRYRQLSATLGQPVRVILPEETFAGEAVEVTPEGTLLVQCGTETREVLAGDVSVRGLMGYV